MIQHMTILFPKRNLILPEAVTWNLADSRCHSTELMDWVTDIIVIWNLLTFGASSIYVARSIACSTPVAPTPKKAPTGQGPHSIIPLTPSR